MPHRPLLACLAAAAALTTPAAAQAPAAPRPSATAGAPAARPADVASPRALVAACYDVISGPAGPRDWDRFRSLFLPGARMTTASARGVRTLGVEDYVRNSGAVMLKEGFFERGTRSRLDQWAHTATIQSLYESRHAPGDVRPFARGINTFVMVEEGGRWWVASLSWEGETPATPIPADALTQQPPVA